MNDLCNLCTNGDVTYTDVVCTVVITLLDNYMYKTSQTVTYLLHLLLFFFYIFFNPLFPTMIIEHIYIDVLLSTVEIIFPKLRVKRVKYQDQSGDRHNLDHSKLFVWTNVTSRSVSLSVCLQSTSSTLPRQRGSSCERVNTIWFLYWQRCIIPNY